MSIKKFCLATLALCCFAASTFAQGDVFYSFSPLNSGATNSFADGSFGVGESGSIYLYYNTDNSDLDTGFFLDITTSNDGVIEFTGGTTFDFEIQIADTTVGWRYTVDGVSGNGGAFGPGTVSTDAQTVEINAFNVTGGDGIISVNEGNPFLDLGYDAAADAFLIGRLDFDVVGGGSTELLTSAGSGGIVHNGQSVSPVFGGARISVPEPTTAGLLTMGLTFLAARRRRI